MTHTDYSMVINFRPLIVAAVTYKLYMSEHQHSGDTDSALLCDISYRAKIDEIANRLQSIPLRLWQAVSELSDYWVWDDVIQVCVSLCAETEYKD